MAAQLEQPWPITLLTSGAFVFLCALLIGSAWLIYFLRSGKELPRIRGKHKDTEFEIEPAESKAASTNIPAPVPEVGSPEGEERPKDVSVPSSPPPKLDPALELFVQILKAREGGIASLRTTWQEIQGELATVSSDDRQGLEVDYLRYRLELGDAAALGELIELSKANPTWRQPTVLLATRYVEMGDWIRARDWADETINRAVTAREHSHVFALRVRIEARLSATNVEQTARKLLAQATRPQTKASIFIALAEIAVEQKRFEHAAICYQAAFAEDPDNIDNRFAGAHAISETGNDLKLFSYLHYRKLEKTSPEKSFVLNNLAYVCDEMKDPSLYGHYLERALAVDKAWVTVNIANKLAEIGFVNAAEKMLAELDISDRETDRVAQSREYIARQKRTRQEQQKKLDARADAYGTFFDMLARDFVANEAPAEPSGVWVDSECSLSAAKGEPGYLLVQIRRRGTPLSGTLVQVGRHYRGRVDSDDSTMLGKSSFQARAHFGRDRAYVLLEELNYNQTNTVDGELRILSAST